jgi:hypothetical protein
MNLSTMKEETSSRIQADIAASDLGKARDRLHGLIATYPNDLTLRLRLGQVYWELQYPAMAGRYWYLEQDKTPAMADACRSFERSCGDDPAKLLLAVKFRGDIEKIRDTYAGRTLLELQRRAERDYGYVIEFGKTGRERYQYTRWSGARGKSILLAFAVAVLIALGLMVVGLVTVLQWLL